MRIGRVILPFRVEAAIREERRLFFVRSVAYYGDPAPQVRFLCPLVVRYEKNVASILIILTFLVALSTF